MGPLDARVLWVALALLVGAWLALRLARAWRRFLARQRGRRGARGERVALKLLRRRGYTLDATQAQGVAQVVVDGHVRSFDLRADAMVRKGGRTYVAEFKTGRGANVGARNTRRQLLEYALHFQADGLLLVDATRGEVMEVEFPALTQRENAGSSRGHRSDRVRLA